MKFIFIIGFSLLSFHLLAQQTFDSSKISAGLMEVVTGVAQTTSVGEGAPGGFAPIETHVHLFQPELAEKGTLSDFLELTKHPSLMVRYIAYNKVAKVDTFNFLQRILESFKKTEIIHGHSGCISYDINYSDFLINLFQNRISEQTRRTIDSTLIFDYKEFYYLRSEPYESRPVNALMFILKYRDRMLISFSSPEQQYYKGLKKIYDQEENPILIYSISKYNKIVDTVLVTKAFSGPASKDLLYSQNQLFWCYRSIYDHPRSMYYKYLEKAQKNYVDTGGMINSNESFMYYLALTKFRTPKTISLFRKLLKEDKNSKYNSQTALIWLALHDSQDKYFKPLADSILVPEKDKLWFSFFLSQINENFKLSLSIPL